MSVLLATDDVELYPASGAGDSHGWVEQPTEPPSWAGRGALQLGAGTSDPRAAEGGGAGPFAPTVVAAGVLYLPPDAAPADGMVAVIRGASWVLAQVRYVPDPIGGSLDCYVASVSSDVQLVGSGG